MGKSEPSLPKKHETANELTQVRPGGLWLMIFRRLLKHRSSRVGIFLLGALFLVAIFAGQIAPFDPAESMIGREEIKSGAPPCIHLLGCPQSEPQHIMGIDSYMRDLYSRVIYGTRFSLFISLSTVGFALLIGTFLGLVAGYGGGWWSAGIMRLMDALQAFPVLMLALGMVAVLGPGLQNVIIAIVVAQIPHYARVTSAKVLSLKEKEFFEASRALGAGHVHIILTQILPNILTLLVVMGMLGISSAILDVAALSFLGVGLDSDIPEWGAILGSERSHIFNAPHLVIFPGVAIIITVLAFNLLADGLRDSLDPQQSYFDID